MTSQQLKVQANHQPSTDHAQACKPVVVTPTYNNTATIIDILDRIEAQGLALIVVDDGCTDGADEKIDRWALGPRSVWVEVVRHSHNQGKAAALLTGFDKAAEVGFTHAATIDADLQHDPEDLPSLVEAAMDEPHALVLGARRDDLPNTPARSRVGRWLSNIGIRLATRRDIRDSQCGLRLYPLRLTRAVACRSGYYGYETEIIVRAVWHGWSIVQVPVTSRYLSADQRVSHFRPLLDSLRCTALQARLLLRAALGPKPDARRLTRPRSP